MLVLAQVVSYCVYDKPQNIMQHMNGNIPYMFDCWAYEVTKEHMLKDVSRSQHMVSFDLSIHERSNINFSLHPPKSSQLNVLMYLRFLYTFSLY